MMSAGDMAKADKRRNIVFSLLVTFAAFVLYVNSLGNGFVWDDDIVIVANAALRHDVLSLFSGIDAGREFDATPYYRPLTMLTFLIEDRLHILAPFPMHLVNIVLHAANAFLFFRLARTLVSDTVAALLAGLLFAVHPINAESVNFLSGGRNTLLACFFVLSAYLLHRGSVDQQRYTGAMAGSVFFLLALFSKESALGVLPFIAALEYSGARPATPGWGRRSFGRLLPYALFTLVYFVLRGRALSGAGVVVEIIPGLASRLMDNVYVIPRYLLSVLWPPSLSPRYYIPDDLNLLALSLVAAWLGILGILAWLLTRGRSRATVFGLSWIAVFWLPVSGVVPIPSAPMADRYMYLPALGLWIVVADQVARLWQAAAVRRYIVAGAGLTLALLAVATVQRTLVWKSGVTLFTRYVEQYPERVFGHHNLGCAYLEKAGDLDSAEREFDKAFALDPFFPGLRTQMGYVRLLRGDYEGAIRNYDEALRQNPFDAEALVNRATALDKSGLYEDAVINYRRFLANPGNALPRARPQAEARIRELSQLNAR